MIKKSKIKNKKQKIKLVIFTLITILLLIPLVCQAGFLEKWFENLEGWISEEDSNNTQIINEVNVSASTGNNVIEGDSGQIIEGEEKSSVEIKTIINGEEIESVSTESGKGSISVESRVEVEDEKVSVSREIQYGDEKPAASPSDTQAGRGIIREKLENVGNWFSDFWKGFKSFFSNIISIF
ncbi:MAG: hypothetical protein ACOZAL_03775 [Patescibacteria group bacterium]